MKRFLSIALCAVMVLGILAGCGQKGNDTPENNDNNTALSGTVSTNGSTSMDKVIGALKEQFTTDNPGVTVTYDPTGSGAGIEAVKNGSTDIGLASRALKDQEKSAGLKETTVALDGIAIIVNAGSKVADLTVQQIADIFTADKPVLFAYHSYAHDVRGLIYDRPNHDNFNVHGYEEEGSTTTPYDMVRVNRIDRYELTAEALRMIDADKYADKIDELEKFRDEAFQFAVDNGYDHPDYTDWVYSGVNTDKKGAVTATAATAGDNE